MTVAQQNVDLRIMRQRADNASIRSIGVRRGRSSPHRGKTVRPILLRELFHALQHTGGGFKPRIEMVKCVSTTDSHTLHLCEPCK